MEINVNVNGRIEIDASARLAAIILGSRAGAQRPEPQETPSEPRKDSATYGTSSEPQNASTEPQKKPQAVSAAPTVTGSAELTETEQAAQAPAQAAQAPAKKEITDADLREFMDNAAWTYFNDHLNNLDAPRQRALGNLFRTVSKSLGADRPTALPQDKRDEFRRILLEDVKFNDGKFEILPF